MAKTAQQPPTCKVCGKTLKNPASVQAGIGVHCAALLKRGFTAQKLRAHYKKVTVPTAPAGYIKLATFKGLVQRHKASIAGLTVSKVVKAIGYDRGLLPPIHPIATPVYVGNRKVRYVHPWLASKPGLRAIATGNFARAPMPKQGK